MSYDYTKHAFAMWITRRMTVKTYTIELRVDEGDVGNDNTVDEFVKEAAKHVYTTALLVCKRRPQIALYSGDNFSSTEEILLADDIA